jgi:uncharacterized membrane protein YccC
MTEPTEGFWPYNVPRIQAELRRRKLEVHDGGYLDRLMNAFDAMVERCQKAEARLATLDNRELENLVERCRKAEARVAELENPEDFVLHGRRW